MNEEQLSIHEEVLNAPHGKWVSYLIDKYPEMSDETLKYIVHEKEMHTDYWAVRLRALAVLNKRKELVILGGAEITHEESHEDNMI